LEDDNADISDEDIPVAVPVQSSESLLNHGRIPSRPLPPIPSRPPHNHAPVNVNTASSSSHVAPQSPPTLPPRPTPRLQSDQNETRSSVITSALYAALTASATDGQSLAVLAKEQSGAPMTTEEIRIVIRLLLANGHFEQAQSFIYRLPVDPYDPYRPIDTEVDIFLGYRPVRRDTAGLDLYDFYEELGAGYYFYSHRKTAWDIGRQTDWGDFGVALAYIRPAYRPGYEEREKVRIYSDENQSEQPRRRGHWGSLSLSRLLKGSHSSSSSSSSLGPKYHIEPFVKSSFGYEILIADAPSGMAGTQIKLGPSYENHMVRLDIHFLEEEASPEGGWPIAYHAHTRTHGRLRTLIRKVTSTREE
jgi:hypothetical protein